MAEITITVDEPDLPEVIEVTTGIPGPPGPPGGAMVSGYWDYDFQTVPPVASGHVRTAPDPVVVGQPMTIYLASQDDHGLYWHVEKITPGDQLRLRGSAGTVQVCTVESFTETDPGQPQGYATIVGTLTSSTGQIAKNAKVEVSLIRTAPANTILTAPNGSKWRLVVSDTGALSTVAV